MTTQENSSPKDAPERFKDLLKKAELAEKQAEQLAEDMELQDEPTRPSQIGELTVPSDVDEPTKLSSVEDVPAQTKTVLLEGEDTGGKQTLPIADYEAETAAPPSHAAAGYRYKGNAFTAPPRVIWRGEFSASGSFP